MQKNRRNIFEIVEANYFSILEENILKCAFLIKRKFEEKFVREGYRDFYIGQKIEVDFGDGFNNYTIKMYIIDILIEKEDNFSFIIVPENNENMFDNEKNKEKEMNPLLEEAFGVNSLRVPKDGCFITRHLGRGKYELILETKMMVNNGIKFEAIMPKLFNIPKQTFLRLKILKELSRKELHFSLTRILGRGGK